MSKSWQVRQMFFLRVNAQAKEETSTFSALPNEDYDLTHQPSNQASVLDGL